MSSPAPTRRVSFWRHWLILFGVGIAWKVVVFTLGAAMPRWTVGDRIAHLARGVHAYAQSAPALSLPLWNMPIERPRLVRAMRVLRVDTVRAAMPRDSVDSAACGDLQATMRTCTYIAIPNGGARTAGDTAILKSRLFHGAR